MSTTINKPGFGASNYGSGQTFTKTGKITKGENYIRILPAFGSLAATGDWRKFYVTHWGYAGVNPRDPSKNSMRPFRCIREKDRRSKMITVECPACTFFDGLEARSKELEGSLLAKGKSEDVIKTEMHPIREQIKQFRPEAKWYVNVLLKNGDVTDFKLNHKDHMNGIMGLIKGPNGNDGLYDEDSIDPTAPEGGVWFKITRNGDGISPPDNVSVEMEDVVVNGRTLKDYKRAPLTDEQIEKALKNCKDLSTLGGATLTHAQIQALVDCGGDPEEVDRIFGARPRTEQSAKPTPASEAPGGFSNHQTLTDPTLKAAVNPPTPANDTYVINGKPATKAQYDRYQTILAQKKAEKAAVEAAAKAEAAKAKAKAEEDRLAAEAAAAADAALAIDDVTPAQVPAALDPADMDDESFFADFEKTA
jgi:hypothetical protein